MINWTSNIKKSRLDKFAVKYRLNKRGWQITCEVDTCISDFIMGAFFSICVQYYFWISLNNWRNFCMWWELERRTTSCWQWLKIISKNAIKTVSIFISFLKFLWRIMRIAKSVCLMKHTKGFIHSDALCAKWLRFWTLRWQPTMLQLFI